MCLVVIFVNDPSEAAASRQESQASNFVINAKQKFVSFK